MRWRLLIVLVSLLLCSCIHECPEECEYVDKRFVPAHYETITTLDCGIGFDGDVECRPVLKKVWVGDAWYVTYRGKVSGDLKEISVAEEEFRNPERVRVLSFYRRHCLTGEVP